MIKGILKDKKNNIIIDATVELKNDKFETIIETKTDNNGFFTINNDNDFKYLIAVKDYKIKYLEYWATNINSNDDIELEIIIDTLEIYGLNAFIVNGAYDSIFLYFRPMNLIKYLNKEHNICPNIKEIIVKVDNEICNILETNKVKESIGNSSLDAYLIQVKKINGLTSNWKKIDIKITDYDNNLGMASIFKKEDNI